MGLLYEYRQHCKKLKRDSYSKSSIRRRFYDAKRRCNCIEHPDYKYYGARGIKMLLTKEQWFSFFRKETFKMLKTGEYRDIESILKDCQIDRIDGDRGYEKGNIRLIKSFINHFFTNQKARHLKLTSYLEAPVGLFDMILEKSKRTCSDKIRDRAYLSASTIFLNQKGEPEIPLLYYDVNRPPFFLNKKDNDYTFDCECGKTHTINFKIKATYTYPCGIVIDLAPKNNNVMEKVKMKIINPTELKRAKRYIEEIVRVYDV